MDTLNKKYNFIKHKKICKGMSGDVKYKVEDKNGKHYLLRVAEISEYTLKQHEYNLMKTWNQSQIPMPKAIDFGCCNEGKNVYTLVEWIEGVEVQEVLKKLDGKEQYRLGKESGNILHLIHNSMEQKASDEWYDKYFKVIGERIQAYIDEGVHFDGDNSILEFLEENKELIRMRPQCYLHGDYHMGNMIYTPDNHIKIIDWHTVDFDNYGDPWYEFNRIGLEYPDFASGQVEGYFRGSVPNDFWRLLLYYLAASAITSVVWAKYWAPEEYHNIIQLNQNILKAFDGMKALEPEWYIKK